MVAEPERFRFRDNIASVQALEHEVQPIVNHCKNYIEMANRGYVQDLKSEAKRAEMEQHKKLEREVEEAERRARILQNLKI
jgi:hypothetical protein